MKLVSTPEQHMGKMIQRRVQLHPTPLTFILKFRSAMSNSDKNRPQIEVCTLLWIEEKWAESILKTTNDDCRHYHNYRHYYPHGAVTAGWPDYWTMTEKMTEKRRLLPREQRGKRKIHETQKKEKHDKKHERTGCKRQCVTEVCCRGKKGSQGWQER